MLRNNRSAPLTELTNKSQRKARSDSREVAKQVKEFFEPLGSLGMYYTQIVLKGQDCCSDNGRIRQAIGFHLPEDLEAGSKMYQTLRSIFIPDTHLAMEDSTTYKSRDQIQFMRSSLLDCITSPEQNKDVMDSEEFNKFFKSKSPFGRMVFAYVLRELSKIEGFPEEDERQRILLFLETNLSEEYKVLKDLELGKEYLQDDKEKVTNNRPEPSTVLRDIDQVFISYKRSELKFQAKRVQVLFNNIEIRATNTILKGQNFTDIPRPKIRKAFRFAPKEDKSLLSNYEALSTIFVPENCLAMEQCCMHKEILMPKIMMSSLLDCITLPDAKQNREMLDSEKLANFVKGHKPFGRMVFAYALRELLEHDKYVLKDYAKRRISNFLQANLSEEYKVLKDLEIKAAAEESKDIQIPQARAAYGGRY